MLEAFSGQYNVTARMLMQQGLYQTPVEICCISPFQGKSCCLLLIQFCSYLCLEVAIAFTIAPLLSAILCGWGKEVSALMTKLKERPLDGAEPSTEDMKNRQKKQLRFEFLLTQLDNSEQSSFTLCHTLSIITIITTLLWLFRPLPGPALLKWGTQPPVASRGRA